MKKSFKTYLGQDNRITIYELHSQESKNVNTDQDAAKRENDQESNTQNTIKDYLYKNKIIFQNGWNFSKLSVCKESKDQFFMNTSNGDFFCNKCNISGDWNDFKDYLNDKKLTEECSKIRKHKENLNLDENHEKFDQWKNSVPINTISPLHFDALRLKNGLELERSVMDKYNIRIYESSFLYPVYDANKKMIDVIRLDENNLENYKNEMEYTFGLQILFDNKKINYSKFQYLMLDHKKNMNDVICITDSILNSLAVSQALSIPSIVMYSSDVKEKIISLLEDYNKIIIWFKDKRMAHELAQKLNFKRCNLISHSKSPYDCLKLKTNIKKIVTEDQFSLTNDTVIRFNDISEDIFAELAHAQKYSGTKWRRFPPLNDILKGHRSGEFTIFTGPTGSGKTTFLSEYSIDLSINGVKTLWGSFEIQNHRLAKMMMTQFAGINISKNLSLFNDIAKEFSKLPIYFMNFHGEETLENVIKTMSHAVLLYNIKHVIIDNLQFMMGNSSVYTIDKFTQQDIMIGAFRRFATNFNCHVTIVIHPRKEVPNELLTIASIFGSAKATQEADNVIILQEKRLDDHKPTSIKFIQVVKNRFDGELGRMVLHYNKECLSFSTKPNQENPFKRPQITSFDDIIADKLELDD